MSPAQFLKLSRKKVTSEKGKLFRLVTFSLLQEHRIGIYGQFKGSSGRALIKERKVKIPDPINEMTFLTCLHEIGHVVTNKVSDPTWKKEYLAVRYSIEGALKYYPEMDPKFIEYQKRYLIMKMCMSIRRSHDTGKIWDEVWQFVGQSKELWSEMISKDIYPLLSCSKGNWKYTTVLWVSKSTRETVHKEQLEEV